MKKNISILLFAVSIVANATAQFVSPTKTIDTVQLMAVYSIDYYEDTLNPQQGQTAEVLLLLGKNCSQFADYEAHFSRLEMAKMEKEGKLKSYLSQPLLGGAGSCFSCHNSFCNYPEGKITTTEYIPTSGHFIYSENINDRKWKLCHDTLTVCGYKTQKATIDFGGRKWVAWFCPQLPYSYGPYTFCGLPGLIVKISDSDNYYTFTLKSIGRPEEQMFIAIKDRKDFIKCSKKDYFRAIDAFNEDSYNRVKNTVSSDDDAETISKNRNGINNPIERDRK